VAYTEEQSDDLCYGALKTILEESSIAGDFDIGIERIMRRRGDGIAKALAAAPSARDGARTTFQVFDESWHYTLPKLIAAHTTMMANLPKRPLADPWSLETTTAYEPGAGSVAEHTFDHARAIMAGKVKDPTMFFFHRQAADDCKIDTDADLHQAIEEASGPAVGSWTNYRAIINAFREPDADVPYLKLVWLNMPTQAMARAFDVKAWRELVRPNYEVPPGALITLGFDGSRTEDSTALVGTEIRTGYQWTVGLWERPAMLRPERRWEVPATEVDEQVEAAFATYEVWRMYADPPYWESWIAEWAGRHGKDVVVEWATYRVRQMAYALKAFVNAIATGELSHAEDKTMETHLGNAIRRRMGLKDEDGQPLWLIQKERPDSPHKIDLDMAAVLSWEARNDALTAGMGQPEEPSVYDTRGVLFI
jgi:phage terminase large subunit-like protein